MVKDAPPVPPPESLLEPWRVFVKQERPRQKKNARWRSVPAKDGVELAMPPDSRFRCIVNPLELTPQPAENLRSVAAWMLIRRVRCSNDGWASWTESSFARLVLADGSSKDAVDHVEVLLREVMDDSSIRETTVLLRADQEQRKATTGPPQVLSSDAP
jgi:hypothetical protein